MFPRIIKWFSATAMVLCSFLGSSAGFRISMETVACVAALAIVTQAFRSGRYFWGPGLSPSPCYLIPSRPLMPSSPDFPGVMMGQ